MSHSVDLELATSIAEIYRERGEYELLAMHYMEVGNEELRDKYIELAIGDGVDDDTLIFFRSEQRKLDLIPPAIVRSRIDQLQRNGDYFSLGSLYRTIGNFPESVSATCKGAQLAIAEGNLFTAAFHIKEMIEEDAINELFIIAMEEARRGKDLWWQYRALQELGWDTEAEEFLLKHRKQIEKAGEPHFLEVLAVALGDIEGYVDLRKQEAQAMSAKPESGTTSPK